MKVFENSMYLDDLNYLSGLNLPWNKLKNKSIMISGATGLIGSTIVDLIMNLNKYGLNCSVFALGRSKERMQKRFKYCFDNILFHFIQYDVNSPLLMESEKTIDYIMHLASNTHPLQYSTDPIGTITTNIIGLKNLLDFSLMHNTKRFVFVSSCEIYGENRGDIEKFNEEYCGYINSNTLRAGYPESKRCGESLCQAYIKQKNIDVVIPRLPRIYGPTLLKTDSKAMSQFLHKAIMQEDIVLKSLGNQFYSFLHVIDCVSGLLTIFLKGKCGESYNLADENSDITLKELAKIIADYANRRIIFDTPDDIESYGYSKVTKSLLDPSKIKKLGWNCKYDIKTGVIRTLDILKEIE